MRDFDEWKLARVIDACDGINGRVKLQKMVYLLGVMGYDLPFKDFTIRQHGPFSRSVAWTLDTLTDAGILVEEAKEYPSTSGGEPVLGYSYSVREECVPLIRRSFDVVAPKDKPAIKEMAERLKKEHRAVLEVAATRVFLENEGLIGVEFDDELKRLKGHLEGSFAEAKRLVDELEVSGKQ